MKASLLSSFLTLIVLSTGAFAQGNGFQNYGPYNYGNAINGYQSGFQNYGPYNYGNELNYSGPYHYGQNELGANYYTQPSEITWPPEDLGAYQRNAAYEDLRSRVSTPSRPAKITWPPKNLGPYQRKAQGHMVQPRVIRYGSPTSGYTTIIVE